MKALIITADDFGAAREVNEAVEAAHRAGTLTAASLMVGGPAAADAVARARRLPSLRVGLHLVLVEGRPLLPTSAVHRLLGADGLFRSNMVGLGSLIVFDRQVRRQLAAEITAQFEAFRDTGLTLDHCNAHKHFHLHPVIGELLVAIGARFGLRAVRVPLEPVRVLRNIEPGRHRIPTLTLPFALLLRQRCQVAGLLTPDRVFGLQWSGGMTESRLLSLVEHLPHGLSEIYLHPATAGFPGCTATYQYHEELEALLSPAVVNACRNSSLQHGGFSDFSRLHTKRAAKGAMLNRSSAP